MRNEVFLGSGVSRLRFDNVEKDAWGEPEIIFCKEKIFGEGEYTLKDWQVSSLIDLIQDFVKAKAKYKRDENKKLLDQLEKIRKLLTLTLKSKERWE